MEGLEKLKKDCPDIVEIEFPNSLEDSIVCILRFKDIPKFDKEYKLAITKPEVYPLKSPVVQFITPISHQNITEDGKMCLYGENGWEPKINLSD
ncbi:MAG: hypothetical protein MHPSP_002938, partial [Paramarteilia canceri]